MTPLWAFEGYALPVGCMFLSNLSAGKRQYAQGGYILLSNALEGRFQLEKSKEVNGRTGEVVGALTTCFGWL